MGERLGKVSQRQAAHVYLLGEQAEMVGISRTLGKLHPRLIQAAGARQALRKPECACRKGAFIAFERVVNTVAVDQPVIAQLLADLTGRTIVRPEIAEASALGVARMAADALGLADSGTMAAADRFEPKLAEDAREAIRGNWRESIADAVMRANRAPPG